MNELPRQKLLEIVARFGPSIVHDARRCEGLLRDYCGAYRREIAVLISALEEKVAADLLTASSHTPHKVLLAKLAQRLHDNIAMDEEAAAWAVNSWALALGIVGSKEVAVIESPPPEGRATGVERRIESPQVNNLPGKPTITVSAAGEGDYASIREALAAAQPDAEIRVRPGFYRESVVLNKPITISGEGGAKEITVINTQGSCLLMQTSKATVRGLTLRQAVERNSPGEGFFAVDVPQGQLRMEDCDIASDSLSSVGIHNDSTGIHLQRCLIHSGADSGIYVFDAASATLEGCDVYANRNVNIAVTDQATAVLRRCAIHDGQHAGVVAWNHGNALIEECEIFSNAKAGVGSSEAGEVVIRRSRIYEGGNSGVFVHNRGRGVLDECDIYGHAEPEVVITRDGNLMMQGCKVHTGNRSGILVASEGKALLEKSNIYDNLEAGVSIQAGGAAAIRECSINDNRQVAIRASAGADVMVMGCDLTRNRIAAWEIEDGANVDERGNQT